MSRTQEESGATFAFGIVTAVDAGRGWARASLPEYDNLETAFLPVLQRRTHRDKALNLPDVGEQVVLLLDLRGEDGVILARSGRTRTPCRRLEARMWMCGAMPTARCCAMTARRTG